MSYTQKDHDRDCKVVRQHMDGWLPTGQALQRIHDGQHYDGTFEDFCKSEFGMSRVHGWRLMKAANVVNVIDTLPPEVGKLLPIGNIREAHARELASLENDEQIATVAAKAVETAPRDKKTGVPKLTAKHIRETAEQVLGNGQPDDEPEDDDEDEPEVEPTARERMEEYNRDLEGFCRRLTKFFADECPDEPWVHDRDRIGTAKSQVKSACATLRTAKAHDVCPKCGGDGCKACLQTGYLPKMMLDQMG